MHIPRPTELELEAGLLFLNLDFERKKTDQQQQGKNAMVFPSIFGTMFVQDGFAKQASAARAKQLADAEAEEKRIAACLGIEFGRRNERA